MNFFDIYLLFWIYSFLGWVLETTLVSFKSRKFINRGFFLGPYCPIYGTGGVLLLFLNGYREDPFVVFILSIFICSLVEYLTSYFMELIYRVRWWDYSNRFFNINGRICLFNSVFFGLFGTLAVCFFNPFFENMILNLSANTKFLLLLIVFVVTTIDMVITFNAMFDFRKYVNSLKGKTFANLFKVNSDSTEEMSKRVRNSFKEKSFIHKHLLKAFNNLKVYRDSFFKKGEELIKYQKVKIIENTFIIVFVISIIIGIILGYIFNNIGLFIVLSFAISLIIARIVSRSKNGK
ncbi:MAG: putative ABC transporter permease [Bacilli bacterium]|nr:putative ABC transporter permease [Bacilli bacterium]